MTIAGGASVRDIRDNPNLAEVIIAGGARTETILDNHYNTKVTRVEEVKRRCVRNFLKRIRGITK